MYALTSRMEQQLESLLTRYHDLFDGGRCQGWELEELIVKAINSDTSARHQAIWSEAGHDDKADIVINTAQGSHEFQIKSGKFKKKSSTVSISGHRLTRFGGNLTDITNYLNATSADFLLTPYEQTDDATGRHHEYKICYLAVENLHGVSPNGWEKRGASCIQVNQHGVEFKITPNMSWQVWWEVPMKLLKVARTIRAR